MTTRDPAALHRMAPREVPEWESGYPEPANFGVLPMRGLFARPAPGAATLILRRAAEVKAADVAGVPDAHWEGGTVDERR